MLLKSVTVPPQAFVTIAGRQPPAMALYRRRADAVAIAEQKVADLQAPLLVPYLGDEMRMWEISPRVNSPKNDDPLPKRDANHL